MYKYIPKLDDFSAIFKVFYYLFSIYLINFYFINVINIKLIISDCYLIFNFFFIRKIIFLLKLLKIHKIKMIINNKKFRIWKMH